MRKGDHRRRYNKRIEEREKDMNNDVKGGSNAENE